MVIFEKILFAVEQYNGDRDNLTATQIAELRADLSSSLFLFAKEVRDIDKKLGYEKIQLEKLEGDLYLEYFEKYKTEGKSQSVAEGMARKMLKSDDRYVKQSQITVDAHVEVNYAMKVFSTGAQVCNSMSYQK